MNHVHVSRHTVTGSTPEAWRRQFWGQKDYTNAELALLQTPPPTFNGTRMEWFASQPTLAAHNRQTRFLAGVSDPHVPITRQMLQQAKTNLRQMDVVGVLENLNDYFDDLACVVQPLFDSSSSHTSPESVSSVTPYGPQSPALVDNQSNRDSTAMSKTFREAVYRHSWADYELVQYARQLAREQRVRLADVCSELKI